MSHKLGIIVPYRNRYRQLIQFRTSLHTYMLGKGIDYVLIVVEQDDASSFNRGKLLNIGFMQAKEAGCDYVVFHDVDMIPDRVDYSYSDVPIHLATGFIRGTQQVKLHFDTYFGGVTLFPCATFEYINGYSNEYWGWGFEDDDLFYRVKRKSVPTSIKKIKTSNNNTAALRFNGNSAFVQANNTLNVNRSFSIVTSFEPSHQSYSLDTNSDRNIIFCLPGYDFALVYNSFNRYSIEFFDRRNNMYTIDSEIMPPTKVDCIITWNNTDKELSFYINGALVGKRVLEDKLRNYNTNKHIFIGCNSPLRSEHRRTYFSGKLSLFAMYNVELTKEDIKSLASNEHFGLTQVIDDYNSGDNLILYYDPKFIKNYTLTDLSGNNNPGIITDCSIEKYSIPTHTIITVPKRRPSTFLLVGEESSAYVEGRWASQLTRYNQLRYNNEVITGYYDVDNDGLSNLEYTVHGSTHVDKDIHIIVGI